MTELSSRFMPTARTFAKGKKWRPGGNKPYLEVLLAIAKIPELVIAFDNVLGVVSDRRRPGIKAIRQNIANVILDSEKNVDLRKQIAFEDPSFSIEDSLFRYFLTNLNPSDLYRDLGLAEETLQKSSIYTYDVAFSFAGETRQLVEFINEELKSEGLVTFYDFDQQAFLLAEELERVMARIYGESARYTLVFIEESYASKVWTKFEKDILTNSRRSKHIIPVVLDRNMLGRLAGIPSTIGFVDLSDHWSQILSSSVITEDAKNAIRNRVVLPLVEKVDTFFQEL
jgi:hypothetical protein